VKTLHSDNRGKFDSKVFADWIQGKGIVAERSLAYHHFQNGAAERFNRTVADMGRSLLYNSSLGKEFWGYAFTWSSWTLNRIPNKTTKDVTPYKCFYGNKPQLNNV
jgi:transposase InsO family protein